jgi:hypothetical protein
MLWVCGITFGIEYGAKELKESCRSLRMLSANKEIKGGQLVSSKSTRKSNQVQVLVNLDNGKPLVVSKNGGNITGFGGLPLVGGVEKIFKLVAGATERLKDHRTEALIKHNQFDLVFARVLQITAGLADGNDANFVSADAGLKKALGRDPEEGMDGPSQASFSRLENAVDEDDLNGLFDFLIDYYITTHRKAPRRIVLYCDGSAVEAYGAQEGAVYRGGKYKQEMFFPLFIFDQDGWLIAAKLRPSDNGEAPTGTPVLKNVVGRLKSAWPEVKIGIRADAAFVTPKLFDWCEDNDIDYAIGIAGNFAIASISHDYQKEAQQKFKRKYGEPVFIGKKGRKKKQRYQAVIRRMPKAQRMEAENAWRSRRVRVYGEITYQARTWRAERRIICRCDYTDDGSQAKYVVTNISGSTPQYIYEQEYCIRAGVELSIKEFKNSMLLRLSCPKFSANAFRVYLHGFAYQLLYHLRAFLKPVSQKLSLESIRKRFITIPALVTCSQRRVYWALSDTYTYAREFMNLCRRLARAG